MDRFANQTYAAYRRRYQRQLRRELREDLAEDGDTPMDERQRQGSRRRAMPCCGRARSHWTLHCLILMHSEISNTDTAMYCARSVISCICWQLPIHIGYWHNFCFQGSFLFVQPCQHTWNWFATAELDDWIKLYLHTQVPYSSECHILISAHNDKCICKEQLRLQVSHRREQVEGPAVQ